MTNEDIKNQELYLKEIGCDLSPLELEMIFTILNVQEVYLPRNIFIMNLRQFSGISIDENDKDDLKMIDDTLRSLSKNGYISREDLPGKVTLTRKAQRTIDKLTRNVILWKNYFPKRWRQVIFRKNKYEIITYDEIKILKVLIENEEYPISKIKYNFQLSNSSVVAMAKKKRLVVNNDKQVVERGPRFIEGLAEAVNYLETKKTEEDADKWLEDIELFIAIQKKNVSRSWKRRYEQAYERAKEFTTCPVGLPADCKNVFKEDADSIIPSKQLSIRELGLRINIKKGFGYMNWITRHAYAGLVIEFIQSQSAGDSKYIQLNGTKQEMMEFFMNIRLEAEKMNEELGLKFEAERIGESRVLFYKGQIHVNLVVLAETGTEKITAISYDEINEILENIEQYPD